MKRISIYGAKGGQGVTTLAAAVAVAGMRYGVGLDRVGIDGHSWDDLGAVFALGNTPMAGNTLKVEGEREIVLDPAFADLVVQDCGPIEGECRPTGYSVLVIRNDYYAARRAVRFAKDLGGMVVILEKDRALGEREVRDCVGLPVLALMELDPALARANDAGVLTTRLPDSLALVAVNILKAAGVEILDPRSTAATVEDVSA